jgi:hypothetical protein
MNELSIKAAKGVFVTTGVVMTMAWSLSSIVSEPACSATDTARGTGRRERVPRGVAHGAPVQAL